MIFLKQEFSLIITIVNRGFSDPVINVAKSAGAEGATILTGRGTGVHETDTVMGVQIQPEKEILLILVKKNMRRKIMEAIAEQAGLNSAEHGLCFSVPVDNVAGITHLMQSLLPNLKLNVKAKTKSVLPPSVNAVEKIEKDKIEKQKTKVVVKKKSVKKAVTKK